MRSPHAAWRPVGYEGLHGRVKRRAVLCHTNGGGSDHGSLYGWWNAGARGSHGTDNRHVGAHFQVATSGHAEQYVDTDLVVYHAYGASEWAVGIETEDDGHPSTAWTDAQVATIVDICTDLHVPPHVLTSDQPGDGVGWHEQFPAWNRDGHRCPGGIREQQVTSLIVPALGVTPPHLSVVAANKGYFTVSWTQTTGATSYLVQIDGRTVTHTTAGRYNSGGVGRIHGRHEVRVLATGPDVRVWSNPAVVTLP